MCCRRWVGPKVGGSGGEQPTGTTWMGAKSEMKAVQTESYLNKEAAMRVNILGAVSGGEGDDNPARGSHVEKLPGVVASIMVASMVASIRMT